MGDAEKRGRQSLSREQDVRPAPAVIIYGFPWDHCYIPAKFSAKSKTLAYVLNEDEVRSFFRELDSYQPAIRGTRFERLAMEYRAIYRLIFCCGLRVSEARLLKRSDVDLSGGKAKAMIKQSKGRKAVSYTHLTLPTTERV